MKNRKLTVINHNDQPLAVHIFTSNTESYSAFFPVSSLNFVTSGSLTFKSEFGSHHISEGSCYFQGKFANYIIERALGSSGIFESYSMILPDVGLEKSTGTIAKIEPCDNHEELFSILKKQFQQQTSFDQSTIKGMVALSSEIIAEIPESEFNNEFLQFVYNNLTINVTLEQLARKYGKSTTSFSNLFSQQMGCSPHKWIKEQRLHLARLTMQHTQKPVSDLYLDMGFEDLAHFSKSFKKQFGYNPSDTYGTIEARIIEG